MYADTNSHPDNWLADWLKMPGVVCAFVVAVAFVPDPVLFSAVRHSAFDGLARKRCAIILNEIETAEYADAEKAAAGISVE